MVPVPCRAIRPVVALAVAALFAAPGVVAQQAQQPSCAPSGMSGQCSELGSIIMDFQRDVKGQPIDVSVRITLDNNYREQARFFLFSVRNVSVDEEPSPVTVDLKSFRTALGEVAVTNPQQPSPNELNLWVDVLDIPVGQPIDLTVTIGVREAGAFYLEALVMPFDRAYHPIKGSQGQELSLFAFTLLAVNQPTGAGGSGGLLPTGSVANALPGMEAGFALAAALVAGLVLRGRGGRPAGAAPRGAAGTSLRLFRRP
jgi:hypothetical protein